jgi:hypothetical protein
VALKTQTLFRLNTAKKNFQVFHTEFRRRYEDIENNVYPMDRKFGICFENEAVQVSSSFLDSKDNVLDNPCKIASNPILRKKRCQYSTWSVVLIQFLNYQLTTHYNGCS